MLAALSMTLALSQPQTHLVVGPWTGKDLAATATSAARYRLMVTGKPNAVLHLRASQVAQGWLAAFCTPNVCSPTQVVVNLSPSGRAVIQFELIREGQDAAGRSGARITGSDGSFVDVPVATR
ncbi:MAG TPA: hypothetical protein VNF68_09895 [Candidatus Baltobacteraceae bacterium]|nr:hypothetical protein [Candidatus Baltobacteraceae bacterium]